MGKPWHPMAGSQPRLRPLTVGSKRHLRPRRFHRRLTLKPWHLITLALLVVTCTDAAPAAGLLASSNMVAWCIVPFDAKKRGPEERAQMLDRLGIRRLAYDYRAEHIPTFDAEVEAMKRHHIEFLAWWFPGELNDEARGILAVIERHKITPQLWVMGGGPPTKAG